MLRLCIVGDTGVGKTCLIINYMQNKFDDNYEPTVLDVYKGTKDVSKKQIYIEFQDTAGDDLLGVNRKIQYKDSDVFIVCVAANSKTSLQNAIRWRDEIEEIEPGKPIALILTKSDLLEMVDDGVDAQMFQDFALEHKFDMCDITSSKEW